MEDCIATARGNLGLQDWLFQQATTAPERCDAALLALARYLTDGVTPEQADVWDFLQALKIDALLALLTSSEGELLRYSTLFEQPVPLAVLEALAQALVLNAGTPIGRRLLALGLWDAVEDGYQPSVTAVAINA